MNIYLHVETSFRELDSKLLLAVLAASKGHQVVVSRLVEIIHGLKKKVLAPGIFHTKSLTPDNIKIERHQKIIDGGSKVTSFDEESGFFLEDYNQFAVDRYSELTLEQSSAAFGWGSEDTNSLKRIYSKNSHKIYKTGSPRMDLWKSYFLDYWTDPKGMPKKPFLLIASNIFCTQTRSFHEFFKFYKDAGYLERNPNLFKDLFYSTAEDYKKLYAFIDAIKYLAKNNNGYDIVLRPHPRDNINAWKIFLEGVENVHIIREDSITAWVKNTFAVMHNGCTTALEATISGKPVLTYSPFETEYDSKLFNILGYNIKSKEELLSKANQLFNSEHTREKKKEELKISELISSKLYIDSNELAAEKILKVWESLEDNNLSKPSDWMKFYWLLKIMKFKGALHKVATKLLPNYFKSTKENNKFPALDENDICGRVSRLRQILKIEKKIECKLISERSILIRSN